MLSTPTSATFTVRPAAPPTSVPDAPARHRAFRFDEETLGRLALVLRIDLETVDMVTGLPRTSASWVVSVGERAYIRSRRGTRRLWYREVQATPWVAVWIDGHRVPCIVSPVTDSSRLAAVTDEFIRKYGYDTAIGRVLHPAAVATTLELRPLPVHE